MNYLSVENLSKAFGEKPLFNNISFGIDQGQKVALVGINGAGKSTLMKIIMGIEVPDEGNIAINQQVKVAYVHQNPVFEGELTIYQTIFSDATNEALQLIQLYQKTLLSIQSGKSNSEEITPILEKMDQLQAWDYEFQIKEVLGKLGLHDTDLPVGNLSGGQRIGWP